MQIDPNLILANARQRSTELSEMYSAVSNHVKQQPSRELRLRPSSFPICSLTLLNDFIYSQYSDATEPWKYDSDYYTSVGTTVHSLVEKWCGLVGYRMWGNWVCDNPTCSDEVDDNGAPKPYMWYYTDKHNCPKCKTHGRYQEIEIEYLGITGHIDCIILTPDGVLIGDYKTTSTYGHGKPTFRDHNIAYALQITSYTYMLYKVWGKHFRDNYNLGMKGCSLLFVCRDNPLKTREFHWEADFALQIGRRIVVEAIISWRAMLRSVESKSLSPALHQRSCKSKADYDTRVGKFFVYEPCPLLDVCVGSKKKDTLEISEHFHEMLLELE